MLILIVGTVVATAALASYNVYTYNKEKKLKEAAYAAIEESASEEA